MYFRVNTKRSLLRKDLENIYAQHAPTEKGEVSKYVHKVLPDMGEDDFLLLVK